MSSLKEEVTNILSNILDDYINISPQMLVKDMLEPHVKELLALMVKQEVNKRYYLSGVKEDGAEDFLISELTEENAFKSADKYLKGSWKFDKIKIWTADEEFCEYLLKENRIGQQ